MFKRLGILVLSLLCMVGVAHADSDTINTVPSNVAAFFSQNANFLENEDANRWQEQGFGNFVSTFANSAACLGVTGAGLTMNPTTCIAYNAGFRSLDTNAITFPNNSTCWVAMDDNTSGNNAGLPTFTRYNSTHYLLDCTGDGESNMPSNAQLLMFVTTSSGSITAVTDERTTNISFILGNLTGNGTNSVISNFGTVQHDIYMEGLSCHTQAVICKGDASITSGQAVLTCPNTAPFTSSMVGQTAVVFEAGSAAAPMNSTVLSYQSASQITLANNASSSASNVYAAVGVDDQSCIKNALNLAGAIGGTVVHFQPGKSYFFHNYDTSGQGCGSNGSVVCDGTSTLNNIIWDVNGANLIMATGNSGGGASLFETGGLSVPTGGDAINNVARGDLQITFTTAAQAASVCTHGFGLACPIRITPSGGATGGETNFGTSVNTSTGVVTLLYPAGKAMTTATAIDQTGTVTYGHGVIDTKGTGRIYIGQNDHFNVVQNVIGEKHLYLHLYPMDPAADVGEFWNNVTDSETAYNTILGNSCKGPWLGGGQSGSQHSRSHHNLVSMTCSTGTSAAASTENGEDNSYTSNSISLSGASGDIAFECGASFDSVFSGNTVTTPDNAVDANAVVGATNCAITGNAFHGQPTFKLDGADAVEFSGNSVDATDALFQGTGIWNIVGNHIHRTNCAAIGVLFNFETTVSLQSTIVGNTILCDAGSSTAFRVADPGSPQSTYRLTIEGNTLLGVTTPLSYTGSAATNLPNRVIQGNSGIADYTPNAVAIGGTITAGSGPTVITNATGTVKGSVIDNSAIPAAVATTLTIGSDNTVHTMSRNSLAFPTGNLTLSGLAGETYGAYKLPTAITVENLEGVSIVDTGCVGSSIITIYDCGSSAPNNVACSGGTAVASVTLSLTLGTVVDGSISSANVAAGEYLGAQVSSIGASCTVLNALATLAVRPQ